MSDPRMKLSIPRDSLSGALQLVGRAVSTRGALPSLGGVLLVVEQDQLTLRATDMELAITRARRRAARARGQRAAARPPVRGRRSQPAPW